MDPNSRTVALMGDNQTVIGFVTIPIASPGEPILLKFMDAIYVAGPSGGGGGPNDLVPGHPEIGDGYVLTEPLEIDPNSVTLLGGAAS